jgi:hypothetical protein
VIPPEEVFQPDFLNSQTRSCLDRLAGNTMANGSDNPGYKDGDAYQLVPGKPPDAEKQYQKLLGQEVRKKLVRVV